MDSPMSSTTTSPPQQAVDERLKSEMSLLADGVQFSEGRSDPLDILLQTISNASNPDHPDHLTNAASSDWSQISSWATGNEKPPAEFGMDFDFSLPMDLDFNPNMAVDPSALHFNPSMFTPQNANDMYHLGANDFTSEFISASMFPFESNSWNGTTSNSRRLSVTSSSSSSGPSLSPVISQQSSVTSSASSDSGQSESSDPASELAQRVRQLAGVTVAVPVSAQVQQLAAAGGQTKLPIPRLHRPTPPPVQTKRPVVKPSPSTESLSSASQSTRTPSPTREPSSEQTPPPASSPEPSSSVSESPPPTTATGRPKTSHTTIERRYRTNLNARITGLKQAVPALRVLEVKNGAPNVWGDVVDERGFVDGVKVARKMSKANVLGKATEYIRVLKKREVRLKREQDGLKSLVSGLVGGPALLKEWEREWRDKFGGEEKDEVEDDLLPANSDDEDGDGEDSDGEDEEGRAKKKAKVAKAAVKKERPAKAPSNPVPTLPGQVPEKRKRGRPRKNPLPVPPTSATTTAPALTTTPSTVHPPITAAPSAYPTTEPLTTMPMPMAMGPDVPMQQSPVQPTVANQQQPAAQYLLAVFAFFSVFNSPLTSSYMQSTSHPHHAHHGVVLSDTPIGPYAVPIIPPVSSSTHTFFGYGVHELVQAFHLLVSTLVLFYVVVPWLSNTFRQNPTWSVLSRLSTIFSRPLAHPVVDPLPPAARSSSKYDPADEPKRTKLKEALAPARRGAEDEAEQLRGSLGVSTGVFGLMQGVIKAARHDQGIEMNQLEQRAWVRLGELVAFDARQPRTTRLQAYWCMSCHISTYSASTTDLTTLALIVRPVSRSKAQALWEQARERAVRPYENIVLSNMDVHEAADWLERWRQWHISERKTRCAACEKRTPLGVLAAILLRERLRKHAASMFVRTVVPQTQREFEATYDHEQECRDEKERKETIEAGKSIGGRTGELASLLERTWDTGFCPQEDFFPRQSSSHRSGDILDDEEDCEDEHDLASTDEAEIRALISATSTYRSIFPSSFPSCPSSGPGVSLILSPPPSPTRKNVQLHVELRTALGNPAFDDPFGRLDDKLGVALEDARDRVVDLLVELERAGRRNGRYQ